jgi:hypothetical protein
VERGQSYVPEGEKEKRPRVATELQTNKLNKFSTQSF